MHPVHDTVTKTYRHLNFFQHECELEVRLPRLKRPDGKVMPITPPWSGKLSGFTPRFEAFVLLPARETTFTGASRISGLSVHRVMALCERYVNEDADADPERRRVIFVAEGKVAATVEAFEANLRCHHGRPSEIEAASIDRSPALISGVREPLPNAEITFDTFHVIAHASEAIDQMRRIEQKLDPGLKGMRWVLLKDRATLTVAQRSELDRLLAKMTTTRTARAWQYREQLREILTRKQPHVARLLLNRWCSNVLRSKVEPMKEVAQMIRNHLEGILAWVASRQTNGFLEAINGLFQAAKRKARGYGRFRTIRMVIFMIAGKLDFSRINPYVAA